MLLYPEMTEMIKKFFFSKLGNMTLGDLIREKKTTKRLTIQMKSHFKSFYVLHIYQLVLMLLLLILYECLANQNNKKK